MGSQGVSHDWVTNTTFNTKDCVLCQETKWDTALPSRIFFFFFGVQQHDSVTKQQQTRNQQRFLQDFRTCHPVTFILITRDREFRTEKAIKTNLITSSLFTPLRPNPFILLILHKCIASLSKRYKDPLLWSLSWVSYFYLNPLCMKLVFPCNLFMSIYLVDQSMK